MNFWERHLKFLVNVIDLQVNEMIVHSVEFLLRLFVAFFVLVVIWQLASFIKRTIQRFLRRSGVRESLVQLFSKLGLTTIWVVGFFLIISILGMVTIGHLVTGLGLGSIAIGFALKDILENFLAGILILLREPFTIGDFIECGAIKGTVEDITIRDSRIRREDGNLIVVPNATLYKEPVTIRTITNSITETK